MNSVPVAASKRRFAAQRIPIAALHQRVDAVVSPLTFLESFIITPAPRKPIPATTWAATLVVSLLGNSKEKFTNKKEPKLTNIKVLSPAFLPLNCLSTPIQALSKNLTNIFSKNSIC